MLSILSGSSPQAIILQTTGKSTKLSVVVSVLFGTSAGYTGPPPVRWADVQGRHMRMSQFIPHPMGNRLSPGKVSGLSSGAVYFASNGFSGIECDEICDSGQPS